MTAISVRGHVRVAFLFRAHVHWMSEDFFEMFILCTPYCRWRVLFGMAQYLFISGQYFLFA